MRAARLLLGALGLGVLGWGAWLLLDQQDLAELRGVVVWLAGGVVVHDAVLAPLTLLLTAVGARVLPSSWQGAGARAVIVIGTVTLMAIPVLGRFGADYDPANTTVLDRPYAAGWGAVVVLSLVAVAAHAGLRLGRRRAAADPEA